MSRPAPREKLTLAVVAATFAACATALIAGFIYVGHFGRSVSDVTDPSLYQASLFVGLSAVTVAIVACPILFTVVGLPLYRLSVRHRWVRAWHYVAVGFGVSCFASVGALLAFPLDRDLAVPLTIVGGTLATLAFWYVSRPDHRVSELTS